MRVTTVAGENFTANKSFEDRLSEDYKYDLFDKLNAGFNLTVGSSLYRTLSPTVEDRQTVEYLNTQYKDPNELDDMDWYDN